MPMEMPLSRRQILATAAATVGLAVGGCDRGPAVPGPGPHPERFSRSRRGGDVRAPPSAKSH
jgi:hypothetical protein